MTSQSPIKIAAVQMVSSTVVAENIATAKRLIAQAVEQGAQLIVLPEYWVLMGRLDTDKVDIAEQLDDGPIQLFMSATARQYGIWLVGGTLPLAASEAGKVLNTVMVYDPQGTRVAQYDKMHLFSFTRGEESYDESVTIMHGDSVGTFAAPFGKVGLSVCYDLRFPELYRAMGECTLILAPAAFTYTTGKAHWEILLRARAIENQCYVLAAAQGGHHANGRHTWGHSMLIDPWGEIKTCLPEGEGVVVGDIDVGYIERIRESLPALKHRKL